LFGLFVWSLVSVKIPNGQERPHQLFQTTRERKENLSKNFEHQSLTILLTGARFCSCVKRYYNAELKLLQTLEFLKACKRSDRKLGFAKQASTESWIAFWKPQFYLRSHFLTSRQQSSLLLLAFLSHIKLMLPATLFAQTF